MNRENHSDLKKDLEQIAQEGITVDVVRLKEDMCTQFADPNEWIREYVVNAYDAHARHCWISGWVERSRIVVAVEDDGHGMARQGVVDFMTIYRSSKSRINNQDPIGRYGIGKLSVSAVPGQCGFSMLTSTGKEAWSIKAGRLLDQEPITIEPLASPPPQGTRFEIAFETKASLGQVMDELAQILDRYVRFLPIRVIALQFEGDDPKSPDVPRTIYSMNGISDFLLERFGRSFLFKLDQMEYSLAIGLGTPVHEIYQNRVMVTDKYNLLFYNDSKKPRIPHLTIRVDSPGFELPFGRHCLSNEEVLHPLSEHIRKNILPQYLKELFSLYEEGHTSQYNVPSMYVQDIACALMVHDSNNARPWCRVPVFAIQNGLRLSLSDLREFIEKFGVLYMESDDDIGVDYSVFDAPVLALKQPEGALNFLKETFKNQLLCLGSEDIIFEAPAGTRPELGSLERHFESFLGFHQEVLRKNWFEQDFSNDKWGPKAFEISPEELERLQGLRDEMNQAENDLAAIKWRLNYLVNIDGMNPCLSHLFLFRNDNVILNLHHSLIQKLVTLSKKAPALAGHWALAICINENKKILPHLSPDARESLILVDAIGKCGMENAPLHLDTHKYSTIDKKQWQNFLREIDDKRRWVN